MLSKIAVLFIKEIIVGQIERGDTEREVKKLLESDYPGP
jgi:hypothetical protein